MKERYKRNIKSLTEEENEKLKDFKVCVVGCGGLGGYIVEMLARLGIGYITVVDGDTFSESNLNRQLICSEQNLGKSKVYECKKRIATVNSEVYINAINKMIDKDNIYDILKHHNIVIDALDNVEDRFILQDACKDLKIVLVHGAISGWYGQVSTIYPGDDTLNYLYKSKNINNELGNPSFIPPNIASIQVSETIKVLLNKGDNLRNKVLLIDLLYNDYNIVNINRSV